MRADLFAQVQALLAEGGTALPPVHLWNPPLSGDIDIRIAADGRWYHEGTAFERAALVKLFASILKREGEAHFLVTPVEKWRIRVDNTPFVAVDCEVLGEGREQQLVFVTNLGERVHCNVVHPLQLRVQGAEPQPVVDVRNGLLARVARSVFYRLVDSGVVVASAGGAGLWSGGEFFVIDAH
jgi:hypothetical protein